MSSSKMAVGWKFDPTPEEVIKILLNKENGGQLPPEVVTTVMLFGHNAPLPWEAFTNGNYYWLPEKPEKGVIKRSIFVFIKLIRCASNKKNFVRTVGPGPGTWHATTGPVDIKDSDTDETIGEWRPLKFRDASSPDSSSWSMHEYSLKRKTYQRGDHDATDLVICKITRSIPNSAIRHPQPLPSSSRMIAKRAAEECPFQEAKVPKSGDGCISAVVYGKASQHDDGGSSRQVTAEIAENDESFWATLSPLPGMAFLGDEFPIPRTDFFS